MKPLKAVLIAILTVSIGALEATAAPSFLALCHKNWNCDSTLKFYRDQPQMELSWLENTFNTNCPCGDKLLATPAPKVLRVHLINSPCMRNKRCGRYEVLWGYNKASGSRAVHVPGSRLNRRFNAVLERFKRRLEAANGSVQCFVSPCLECDLNGRARRALADRVSAALPSCILVDNPYRQVCLGTGVCEYHGANPAVTKPCIVDMDGTDGRELNVKKWAAKYKDCDVRFYWEPWMNCNTALGFAFIDPRKRGCGFQPKFFTKTKEIICQSYYPSSDTCLP